MHNLKPKLCHIICNQFYEPLQCSFFELCSHTEDRGDKLCKIATLLTQEIANHIDDLEVEHLPSGHIAFIGHSAGIHDARVAMLDSL